MKRMTFLTMSILVMETVTRSAWASGGAETYQGNLLLLLFLGVCVLVIVAQMVPALILMMGTISGFARRVAARKQIAVTNVNQDETV